MTLPTTPEGWKRGTFRAIGTGDHDDARRPEVPSNVPAWTVVSEDFDSFTVDYCPPDQTDTLPVVPDAYMDDGGAVRRVDDDELLALPVA